MKGARSAWIRLPPLPGPRIRGMRAPGAGHSQRGPRPGGIRSGKGSGGARRGGLAGGGARSTLTLHCLLSLMSLQGNGVSGFHASPTLLLRDTRPPHERCLLGGPPAPPTAGRGGFLLHPYSFSVLPALLRGRGAVARAGGAVRGLAMSSPARAAAQSGVQGAWYGGLIKYPEGSAEREVCEKLLRSLDIGAAQAEGVAQLEQGTDAWLAARRHRLTASNFGSAAGRNQYTTREELAKEMLFPTFKGNEATRHGNEHEPIARDFYLEKRRGELAQERGEDLLDDVDLSVTESGLHVCRQRPFLAVSPDGHIHEYGSKGLLEIKCPFYKKSLPEIPPYYMDQLQGCMAILGYEWADFVVWTKEQQSIRRVPFDRAYWETQLLPALTSFYSDVFLPAYVAAELGGASPAEALSNPPPASQRGSNIVIAAPIARAPAPISRAQQQPGGGGPRPKPVISVVSCVPATRPPGFAPQAGLTFIGGGGVEVRPAPAMGPGTLALDLLHVVQKLDAALRPKGLRPEYVGSGTETLFLALARQLAGMGVLGEGFDRARSTFDGVPGQLVAAAQQLKAMTLRHIAVNSRDFETASQMSSKQLRQHLSRVGGGLEHPGGPELLALAQMFKITIVCLLVSKDGVVERNFIGDPAEGTPKVYLCTSSSFFWCTGPVGGYAGVDGEEDEEAFVSRYSPAFQQCVCALEEKFRNEGMDEYDSFSRAFRVCNLNDGDRRYGDYDTLKDGTPIQGLDKIAKRWAELLKSHKTTILEEIEKQEGDT